MQGFNEADSIRNLELHFLKAREVTIAAKLNIAMLMIVADL